jgi:uncharacterized membrane protein
VNDGNLLRLVTVHPALVHFALGTLPLIVLAYGVASLRRSERWAFVGDVATWLTAAIALVAAAFGLASWVTLRWPGGVERWRNLHVGFGVAFVATLLTLALSRARRRASGTATFGTLGAALGVGLLGVVTAWIGGEQLVFRAGMGVTAAGDGALAPPLLPTAATTGDPEGTKDAMHRVRASWGAIETTTASMLVDRPRDEGFATIAHEAAAIERTSGWLGREGAKSIAPDADLGHGGIGGGPPATDAAGETPRQAFERWSDELGETAKSVREAAEGRNLEAVAKTVGRIQTVCVGCHAELRWKHLAR